MVPPPPPPAPPPLVGQQKLSVPAVQSKAVDRSALLSQIHQGTRLKKTVTNDRSAPSISGNKSAGVAKDTPGSNRNESSDSTGIQINGPVGQLGGLFAQGMPKLKPTNRAFLDGGNYKSQLTPRMGLISRTTTNISKLPQHADFKTRISVSQPNTPQIQRQKPYGRANGIIASHDHLNLAKMSQSKINPISLRNSNDSVNTAPVKEETSSTSVLVPNFKRDLTHQSFLHQTDSSKWGGSDPNLTSVNPVKPRTSSKPLPPPRSEQVLTGSNAPVKKPWPPERSKSFEEDKMEKTSDFNKTENSGFLNTPVSLSKIPSEPNELHMLQNHTTLPSAFHPAPPPQNMSCEIKNVIKPTSAPPPLPSKPPTQVSPHTKNVRQPQSGARSSPFAHPTGAPPPPPPPRVVSQTNSSHPKCLYPASAVETKSLPPVPQLPGSKNKSSVPQLPGSKNQSSVPQLPGSKNQSSVPPASETKPSHSSQINSIHTVSNQSPVPPARKLTYQTAGNSSSEVSCFESRFHGKFRDMFELPKPSGFDIKKKTYPSMVAKQRTSNNVERSRLPPPFAPPPPPPPPTSV